MSIVIESITDIKKRGEQTPWSIKLELGNE